MSLCANAKEPTTWSPGFHASTLKSVCDMKAFHRLTTGRPSSAPSWTTVSAYTLVDSANRETVV